MRLPCVGKFKFHKKTRQILPVPAYTYHELFELPAAVYWESIEELCK